MKFIRELLGKKRKDDAAPKPQGIESLEQSYRDAIGSFDKSGNGVNFEAPKTASDVLTSAGTEREKRDVRLVDAEKKAVGIWDLEDDAGTAAAPAPAPTPVAAPSAPQPSLSSAAQRSPARSRRTKTRLIGFEKSDGAVVDLFNDAPAIGTAAAPARSTKFPVGWIVVAEGPGRGESFALSAGMSQIGRGEDQAIQLDFGDNSISRSNHAAIVYDPDSKEFLLGHGGKSNIVRLNDKPLISNETLKTGDVIKIGETVLRFVALCGKSFNWSDGATGEDEDVAIA